MYYLSYRSIAGRLTLSFGLVILLFGAVAATTTITGRIIEKRSTHIIEVSMPRTNLVADLQSALVNVQVATQSVFLYSDEEDITFSRDEYLAAKEQFLSKLDLLHQNIEQYRVTEEIETLTKAISEGAGSIFEMSTRIVDAAANGRGQGNEFFLFSLRDQIDVVRGSLDQFDQQLRDSNREDILFINEQTRKATLISLVMVIVASLIAAIAGWAVIRSVRNPIGETIQSLERIAEGDLSQPVEITEQYEIGRLQIAASSMRENLVGIISGIKDSAQLVTDESATLSFSAEEMRQGSAAQLQSASSMAEMLEQVSVTMGKVSRMAQDANQHAASVDEQSSLGDQAIQSMLGEIDLIAQSVQKAASTAQELETTSITISDITRVIGELAAQTNLLALNAAIEAARAGEQGRGFAVVADEVRSLAERTNRSAQEISEMVGSIDAGVRSMRSHMEATVERVDSGLELARDTGGAIETIRESARKATSLIDEVSRSIQQQVQASEDASERIERMVGIIDTNAKSADQVAQTATGLDSLAATLAESVSSIRHV